MLHLTSKIVLVWDKNTYSCTICVLLACAEVVSELNMDIDEIHENEVDEQTLPAR